MIKRQHLPAAIEVFEHWPSRGSVAAGSCVDRAKPTRPVIPQDQQLEAAYGRSAFANHSKTPR